MVPILSHAGNGGMKRPNGTVLREQRGPTGNGVQKLNSWNVTFMGSLISSDVVFHAPLLSGPVADPNITQWREHQERL